MNKTIKIISPIDGAVIAERNLSTKAEVSSTLQAAVNAHALWQTTELSLRAKLCHQAIDCMLAKSDEIAEEITQLMGRPIKYSAAELGGLEERARYMIDIAEHELADIVIEKKSGFTRYIRKESLGVVLTLAPWNYPYLTAVNSIIPALMAGNTVILKHSAQTLLCAERFYQAFEEAGLPPGVFQYLHLDHDMTLDLVKQNAVAYVSFTGSVSGGKAIENAAAGLFKSVALELGGKDPAYVMPDADINYSAENLLDGAFFNSGQSCCGIERIYVHEDIYDAFIKTFIKLANQYQLANPMDKETTLGPMVNSKAADFVREQIKQAVSMGAKACIDEKDFPASKHNTPYLAPQVLINVDHTMSVMQDESFGPVVGIMKVCSDRQAIEFMNDSVYGLTASIWTGTDDKAVDKAMQVGDQLETGTVFMNRCDYLDPALAWVGVKDSGRGCSLSKLAYQQLTRAKSFHLKIQI